MRVSRTELPLRDKRRCLPQERIHVCRAQIQRQHLTSHRGCVGQVALWLHDYAVVRADAHLGKCAKRPSCPDVLLRAS